jgi:hypothetical protein
MTLALEETDAMLSVHMRMQCRFDKQMWRHTYVLLFSTAAPDGVAFLDIKFITVGPYSKPQEGNSFIHHTAIMEIFRRKEFISNSVNNSQFQINSERYKK